MQTTTNPTARLHATFTPYLASAFGGMGWLVAMIAALFARRSPSQPAVVMTYGAYHPKGHEQNDRLPVATVCDPSTLPVAIPHAEPVCVATVEVQTVNAVVTLPYPVAVPATGLESLRAVLGVEAPAPATMSGLDELRATLAAGPTLTLASEPVDQASGGSVGPTRPAKAPGKAAKPSARRNRPNVRVAASEPVASPAGAPVVKGRQCKAATLKGQQCKRNAVAGCAYCAAHKHYAR